MWTNLVVTGENSQSMLELIVIIYDLSSKKLHVQLSNVSGSSNLNVKLLPYIKVEHENNESNCKES
jgi:hypothetical protein